MFFCLEGLLQQLQGGYHLFVDKALKKTKKKLQTLELPWKRASHENDFFYPAFA